VRELELFGLECRVVRGCSGIGHFILGFTKSGRKPTETCLTDEADKGELKFCNWTSCNWAHSWNCLKH